MTRRSVLSLGASAAASLLAPRLDSGASAQPLGGGTSGVIDVHRVTATIMSEIAT